MTLSLPELPFAADALDPHMSARTLEFHHGKHHKAYVDKGNTQLQEAGVEADSLEALVVKAAEVGGGLFNNVGQHYNHSFFWHSLSDNGGGAPHGELAAAIDRDFGGIDAFTEAFVSCGMGQFGSGWVWLVKNGGKLQIESSANADSPLVAGRTPLLVCDLWEHAYYLDYQNRRAEYLKAFLEKLVNWDFAGQNFANSHA